MSILRGAVHEGGGASFVIVVGLVVLAGLCWWAAITSGRNKGTDSGGAAGIYWIRNECRFPPLQRSPFPLFPSLRSVLLAAYA